MVSQVAPGVKNPAASADGRDRGLIPGLRSSPGRGHGNPLQYSCLENPMDSGAWRAAAHGVAKSQTWMKRLSMHANKNNSDKVIQARVMSSCTRRVGCRTGWSKIHHIIYDNIINRINTRSWRKGRLKVIFLTPNSRLQNWMRWWWYHLNKGGRADLKEGGELWI